MVRFMRPDQGTVLVFLNIWQKHYCHYRLLDTKHFYVISDQIALSYIYDSKKETNFGVFSLDATLQILDFRVFSSALTERAANGTFRPVATARAKEAAGETRKQAKIGRSKYSK